MLSEHNPIAELVYQIQQKWIDEASPYPELKFIRWLIKPDEARLFEGFLKLESTEHGVIPEMLVAMLTPFKNEETYSRDIINDWIKAYKEDKKTQEKLKTKGITHSWEPEAFVANSPSENNNDDLQLLKMISSFQKQLPEKNTRLVVALFPYSIHNMDGFMRWQNTMLKKEIPDEISFMVFDHIGENYFDNFFEKNTETTKTIHVNLDMDGAISKIAKMGDANSPEVKFRECILEMGKALQKNNRSLLDEWGEKALAVTQKSGLKSMFASAHIIYAGMLLNFKQFDKIDPLLIRGLAIAQQGLKLDDMACRPLIIQFYGYMAASKQHQKKMPEAISSYEKQGDTAISFQLPAMALAPYQQAYTLSKKSLPNQHEALIKKAYTTGLSLQKEEQESSNFAAIAYDYFNWHQQNQRWDEATETDNKLKEIFGEDWKDNAKNSSPKQTKNKSVVAIT